MQPVTSISGPEKPVVLAAPTASAKPASPTSSSSTTAPLSGQSEQAGSRASATSTAPDHNKDKDRVTVPSACVQCRSKHLKCDGLSPCSRCSSNGLDCTYVRSRRGFKGPRRNGTQSKTFPEPSPGNTASACPLVHPGVSPHSSNTSSSPDTLDHTTLLNNRLEPYPHSSLDFSPPDNRQELITFDARSSQNGLDLRERCFEAFYYHFYPAHPFLLPRANFMALRKDKELDYLEATLRYIGSFYVEQAPKAALGLEAEHLVYHADCPKDGFRVQALLILAIGLDGYTFQERALQILCDAQDLALELGMNTADFAVMNGGGLGVLEESWRRTWWELYIIDGMIAGVHQKSSFRLNNIPADVVLPCEEKEYISGHIPLPKSIQNFDDESFDGKDFLFSSFTYRIAAIRNLGRVLLSRQIILPDEPAVGRIDAYLVNWKLHLPDSKRVCISSDGYLDEMLFQAHMISEATTVLLHREHSQLDSSVAQDITSCAPHKQIVPGQQYNVHAAKIIQAAQDISKLIMLPVPLVKHTHFFTCVVTLASIVHLSCWSALMPLIHDGDIKQQLRLNTGALKTLWQIWPAAGKAFGQVKGVAQEIYASKKRAAEMGFWTNYTEDEVMRSMIEDHTIMEESQLL